MSSDKTADQSTVDEQKAIGSSQKTPVTRAEKEQLKAVRDFSRDKGGDKLSMRVKVYSPFRDYYDGRAFSISAINETGPFDILPKHHNFISLLSPCDLVIRTVEKGEQKVIISGGIMHVKADQVIVFLDV
jgi:hypothetical protein